MPQPETKTGGLDESLASKPLSPKAERFCAEYLVDLDKTKAARRAGYSASRASQTGCDLYRDARVRARIDALAQERVEATRIRAYVVLEELAVVAFSSIENYEIDDDGRVQVRDGAPRGAIRAVARVKRKRRVIPRGPNVDPIIEVETELALWDKGPQITNALKHLRLLTDRHEHTGNDGAPIAHEVTEHATTIFYMPDNGREAVAPKSSDPSSCELSPSA